MVLVLTESRPALRLDQSQPPGPASNCQRYHGGPFDSTIAESRGIPRHQLVSVLVPRRPVVSLMGCAGRRVRHLLRTPPACRQASM